jgi:hypothetical protein
MNCKEYIIPELTVKYPTEPKGKPTLSSLQPTDDEIQAYLSATGPSKEEMDKYSQDVLKYNQLRYERITRINNSIQKFKQDVLDELDMEPPKKLPKVKHSLKSMESFYSKMKQTKKSQDLYDQIYSNIKLERLDIPKAEAELFIYILKQASVRSNTVNDDATDENIELYHKIQLATSTKQELLDEVEDFNDDTSNQVYASYQQVIDYLIYRLGGNKE